MKTPGMLSALVRRSNAQSGKVVVRESNSTVRAGPGKAVGVTYAGKTKVLNANNVDVRLAQRQCAHYVAVEVLIGKQSQHRCSSRPSLDEQATPDLVKSRC
jgi:hypothetical protein